MFFELFWLFLLYSFAGWLAETMFAAVTRREFVNRGVLNGPLCMIYGFTAVLLTIGMGELRDNLPLLFIFCTIDATLIEWLAGHLLEKSSHGRWWDYSHIRFNMDGYICLPYSLLWGVLGVAVVEWGSPLLLQVYHMVPGPVMHIVLWVLLGLVAVDAVGTVTVILHGKIKSPQVARAHSGLGALSHRLGRAIVAHVERRVARAHPQARKAVAKEKPTVFAQGCGFYKLALLFIIGSVLGDIVETLFCRVTAGVWMSRSSLVWGPFSVVWGLALAAGTLLLYKYRNRSDGFLFIFGTLVGGAYEYACSVFTEICYGTVFWDYSHLPFNVGGRINLLYCFFWGFAAVIWLKWCYPLFSRWIEKIPMKPGKIITWVLTVFMVVNIIVSAAALGRYSERNAGIPAKNAVDVLLDAHFGDERMAWNYPNLKWTDKPSIGELMQADGQGD